MARRRGERLVLATSIAISTLLHGYALLIPIPKPTPVKRPEVWVRPFGAPTPVAVDPVPLPQEAPEVAQETPEPIEEEIAEDPAALDVSYKPEASVPEEDPKAPPLRSGSGDARLWSGWSSGGHDAIGAAEARVQAHLDSAVAQLGGPVFRIGGFSIDLPSCESFLSCELEFPQTGDMYDRFTRYREIEEQAALYELYRERARAMRIRRQARRRNR